MQRPNEKYSRSDIHKYPVIYLFEGSRPSDFGGYLFEESEWIFGRENLASNLIEYANPASSADQIVRSKEFESLVALLQSQSRKKITLVKVDLVTNLHCDIELVHFGSSPSGAAESACEFTLKNHLRLNAVISKRETTASPFHLKHADDFHFCAILLRSDFVLQNHKSLSDRFKKIFSAARYVDSQVPFLMLTPCFSGSALERVERRV